MKKLLIFVLLPLFILQQSCENKQEVVPELITKRYFCDAETLIPVTHGTGFLGNDSVVFLGGEAQCEGCGIDNSSGIKLDSVNLYGLNLMLFDLKPGEYLELTVYEKKAKNRGAIIAKFTGGVSYTLSSDVKMIAPENGWTKHVLNFNVLTDIDTVSLFLHAGGSEAIFDNFEVVRYSEQPFKEVDLSGGLNLFFPDSAKTVIYDNLDACVKLDIIPSSRKEYVDAAIVNDLDTQAIEIRLKGDWTDHIKTGSPSFRIKTNDDYAFEGLRSFSIQHPKTRNYMHEWFFHRVLEKEEILTTTYKFLPVSINGKYKSIYALEEHFDKQLLESRNRREGPILKIDESGFWALLYKGNDNFEGAYPYYESAIIDVFKGNRTRKDEVLLSQFLNGSGLLKAFKNLSDKPEEIFDLDKEAKFYALMELGNIVHGLAWHNRRFYYNPITQRLEHIGYDLQPGFMPMNPTRLENELTLHQTGEFLPTEKIINRSLFLNDEFRENYLNYLEIYSSKKYLDSLFGQMDDEIKRNEEMLRIDMPNYYFDREFYYKRAEVLHSQLQSLKTVGNQWAANPSSVKPLKRSRYKDPEFPFYLKEISLNIYMNEIDSTNYQITMENFHLGNVEVFGYEAKEFEDSIIPIQKSIYFESYTTGDHTEMEIYLEHKPKKFFFHLSEFGDSIFSKKPIKWAAPNQSHPRVELAKKFKSNHTLYKLKGDTILIQPGDYMVKELIYIPKEYVFKMEAGVNINFTEGGGLILNNDSYFLGEKGKPISISSSDKTSSGITILNAKEVVINELSCNNLNTLNKEGWVLTGGFTVYEATVAINGMRIFDAQSEDALNLIRCDFEINNLEIDRTHSDGFDADYCTGILANSVFKNTGNDCVDFSGSVININNISIYNSGDKGISAGEASNVYAEGVRIDIALTGLASKDNSDLNVKNADLKNVSVGVSAFQKKPEFGPSRIYLEEINYENVADLGLIELGSSCSYKGNTYKGYQNYDIDKMYEKFNK